MKTFKIIMYAFALMAVSGHAFAEDLVTVQEEPLPIVKSVTEADVPMSESAKSVNGLPKGIQLGIGVSATSGLNGFVGYANKNFDSFWWKRLGFRFDFATTSPIESRLNTAINDAIGDNVQLGDELFLDKFNLSAKHYSALVDFYPFGNTWFLGGWRITGGYTMGDIRLHTGLTANIDEMDDPMEFELGDKLYRYDGGDVTGKAKVDWKYRGPYLGTGFDLGLFWGIKIYMDAGVVFTSKTAQLGLDIPVTDRLQVSHDDGSTWVPVEDGGLLQAEFENAKREALSDAQDELDNIKAFPMVKLGFMYRF